MVLSPLFQTSFRLPRLRQFRFRLLWALVWDVWPPRDPLSPEEERVVTAPNAFLSLLVYLQYRLANDANFWWSACVEVPTFKKNTDKETFSHISHLLSLQSQLTLNESLDIIVLVRVSSAIFKQKKFIHFPYNLVCYIWGPRDSYWSVNSSNQQEVCISRRHFKVCRGLELTFTASSFENFCKHMNIPAGTLLAV